MRKGYRLQVVGYSFILFVLLSTVTCTLYPTYAADSTPSADIKTKLEELKREIASKAAKLKQEVNRKLKDKAYVGTIKSKSTTSLNLAAKSGPKTVSLNQDTIYESTVKKKAKFSFKILTEEDYVAALGDIDETDVLTAKKIILLDPNPYVSKGKESSAYTLNPKTYLWGQVISISDQLVTLKNRDSKNVAVSMPSISGIKLNAFVILTGFQDKNDIFKAGFVYVIPQGGVIKPKKTVYPERSRGATPSAQTATPSAKPKATSR